jgi:hypothetical protein
LAQNVENIPWLTFFFTSDLMNGSLCGHISDPRLDTLVTTRRKTSAQKITTIIA